VSSDVDTRPSQRVRLRLTEHFARDGRGVPFAEGEELQQIRDRVAFGPAEVRVRDLAGLIADVQQERGDRIRDRRTDGAQDVMAADVDAFHFQLVRSLRRP